MKIIGSFVCLTIICVFYTIINNIKNFDYNFKNAFWRAIWSIDEGTIWAPGFDEKKFSEIEVGMTQEMVLKLLGKPLDYKQKCEDPCFWIYTKQDSGTSDFDQRWVIFNSGRVTEIRKNFFID